MTALLERALAVGLEVRVWYVGLSSPELHLARVRARVAKGGHDIPEAQVRARYDSSRLNLIRLLPRRAGAPSRCVRFGLCLRDRAGFAGRQRASFADAVRLNHSL